MKPETLAERLQSQPFSAVREELMTKVTLIALRGSQQRTPVRTGTLRRSETTRVEAGGLRGYVGTNVVYAPFVHRRAPFFEEGIAASVPEVQRLLADVGDAYLRGLAS